MLRKVYKKLWTYKYSGYRVDVQWCDNNIIKKFTKPTYMQMSLVF